MTSAILERTCEQCGGPIPPDKRSDALTCSDQCRWELNRAKRAVRTDTRTASMANRAGSVIPIRSDVPLTWDPPSGPRQPRLTAELCPACGNSLITTHHATWRVCGSCKQFTIPPAVSDRYERENAGQRPVVSQRDRDLEAIALARRKGIMLAQLAQLAGDDRLHPESVPVVEWLSAEVRAAGTGARLDDLASLAVDPAAGIRRAHWWQGQPAAIDAPTWADDDEDQGDGEEPLAPVTRLTIAAARPAAQPRELTWDDAISALGWRLDILRTRGCQIIAGGMPCGADAPCPIGENTWACRQHHDQLARFITRARRPA